MNEMSIEQKIVYHLADSGFITSVGDVQEAMKSLSYAKLLITGDGIEDDVKDAIDKGEIEVEGLCDHEPLSNPEIDVVFDNDEPLSNPEIGKVSDE